ncbi:tyrosine-tRNA ligase [Polychytrium aggregatum]|uniref:tyrosine-tRNA ligase n=1 Tax=Polychytrium aggregatum TaxID=110093 RepID=UPI0022FF0B39|nr:tyrosine-tRNA ligase [Polychytrium aggregatum]KAI9205350.1 tyrosine-tRNA ligase [Polychytrium aggregatum]
MSTTSGRALRQCSQWIGQHRPRLFAARFSACAQSHNVIQTLKQRSLIQQTTSDAVQEAVRRPNTVYAGFDPTASSLHCGNLVTIMGLLHFYAHGHQVIALVGGATGTIGDPSGRSTERTALSRDAVEQNVHAIQRQLERVFQNAERYIAKRQGINQALQPIKCVNNYAWYKDMSFLSFISDVGRLIRVGDMISRDSVRSRLDSPEGISFTEFSYQLLQAYDFLHLYQSERCRIQLGGSDQWGNIITGTELIRKRFNEKLEQGREAGSAAETAMETPFGVTMPLLTTAAGEKFGKSAGNAVWLDENLVSHYQFYQFFRRTPDSEVEKLLRFFTFLPVETINELMARHAADPAGHLPQRTLAREATELVHGEQAAIRAETKSNVLFDSDFAAFTLAEILDAFESDEIMIRMPRSAVIGKGIMEVAAESTLTKSRSAARKLIGSGGLYIQNRPVASIDHVIAPDDLIHGSLLLLRSGKSHYKIVHLA